MNYYLNRDKQIDLPDSSGLWVQSVIRSPRRARARAGDIADGASVLRRSATLREGRLWDARMLRCPLPSVCALFPRRCLPLPGTNGTIPKYFQNKAMENLWKHTSSDVELTYRALFIFIACLPKPHSVGYSW